MLWYRVALQGEVVLIPEIVMSYRYHSAQSRPADIQRLRNQVARRAVRLLPPDRRRSALSLRRSGYQIEQAESQISQGNPFRSFGLCASAVTGTPGIFRSPLIGEWVIRRIGGRFYRRFLSAPGT